MAQCKLAYSFDDNLNNKTDEQLVTFAKEGNEKALEYLFERYKSLVNMKVSKYFIVGAEKEDIFQEGMIGLYKAIKSYDPTKQNSFKTFVENIKETLK